MVIRDFVDDADRVDFAMCALQELLGRLKNDDAESAKSIAESCILGIVFGTNSPEFQAHHLVETSRFNAMNKEP